MNFADKEHEKFWNEKYLVMQEYGKTDTYYKSIVYTLGICTTTREKFSQIFNLKDGEINIDSLGEVWQTHTSSKVTRMAFSLWNGCNYDSTEEYNKGQVSSNYNVSDLFCCEYAKYFMEAIKIRYPEYCLDAKQKNIAKTFEDLDNEIKKIINEEQKKELTRRRKIKER